jgi:hypothetical protein
MKTLILFLFLIIRIDSFSEIPLGIGIVRIQFEDKTIINFYKNPEDKSYSKQIEFFNDATINSFNIRNLDKERVA